MSLEAVGSLREPVRRAVYEYVVACPDPVSRNAVSAAVGIGRTLAAFHLDKLVDSGLLETSYATRTGGPGSGRPAKLYRRSAAEYALTLPPRDYRLLADVLAAAVLSAGAEPAVYAAARDEGARLAAARSTAGEAVAQENGTHSPASETTTQENGARSPASEAVAQENGARSAAGEVVARLAALGYEPVLDADGTVRLRNCPFHAVAQAHPPLVCGLNLALLEGLIGGAGHVARLVPEAGGCCVTVACKNNIC